MINTDKLIVFDGGCGLCHAWVRFVLRHDKQCIFRFSAMQSDKGQAVLRSLDRPLDRFETMLYLENGIAYEKSMAFLKIVQLLPMPIKLLSGFYIIPTFFRDYVYKVIANQRYRLFGQCEECRLTEGDYKDRFI